ncbi:MAG: DUF2304 family protein [Bryobacteraceae bacterium]|nr:DUF2304 family protein [Bryobacteraceae bacterium]
MVQLPDLLALLSVLLLLVVLRAIRREHIRVEYSVSWLAAAVALLALSRSGAVLERAAAALGVQDPALVLLALILIVFLGVFYRFSRIVSELKEMNITLTQRVAILEFLLRERDEKA